MINYVLVIPINYSLSITSFVLLFKGGQSGIEKHSKRVKLPNPLSTLSHINLAITWDLG